MWLSSCLIHFRCEVSQNHWTQFNKHKEQENWLEIYFFLCFVLWSSCQTWALSLSWFNYIFLRLLWFALQVPPSFGLVCHECFPLGDLHLQPCVPSLPLHTLFNLDVFWPPRSALRLYRPPPLRPVLTWPLCTSICRIAALPPSAADLHPSLSSSLFPFASAAAAASVLLPLAQTDTLSHSTCVSPAKEYRCHSDWQQCSPFRAVSSLCCTSSVCFNLQQTLIFDWMIVDVAKAYWKGSPMRFLFCSSLKKKNISFLEQNIKPVLFCVCQFTYFIF